MIITEDIPLLAIGHNILNHQSRFYSLCTLRKDHLCHFSSRTVQTSMVTCISPHNLPLLYFVISKLEITYFCSYYIYFLSAEILLKSLWLPQATLDDTCTSAVTSPPISIAHKQRFDQKLEFLISTGKSLIVTQQKYDNSVRFLQCTSAGMLCKMDAHFKAWVRNRKFSMLGSELVVPNKKHVCILTSLI